ncbi:MAG: trigger factor [Bacillota bacterium]
MKVNVVKKEGSRVTLEVEAPASVVDEAYGKAYKSVVRRVNIPGFRRGKAPRHIVERFYGVEPLKEEAIRETLPGQYIKAVEEAGIEPVDDPEFDDIEFDLGKPLKFTASVDVRPEVQLGEYGSVSVPFETPQVTDEEVDRQFDLLRDRMSELRPLEEGVVLEAGHYANCHVKALEGGHNPLSGMDDDLTYIEVGNEYGLIPGLSQALVGMKSGESKEFTCVFPKPASESPPEVTDGTTPEKAEDEAVSDETALDEAALAKFVVTVKETYEKHLPEIDEVLKTIGQDTVEDAKKDIKQRITNMRLDMARRRHADEVETKVVEMSSVEIPRAMINRKAQEILERFAQRLKESGTDFDQYMRSSGRTPEDLTADIEKQAEKEVKTELVFDAIAVKEGIEVSEETVDKVVASLAQQARAELGAMKTTLDLRGALAGIRKDLARSEALHKISTEAAIRAGTPIPEAEPVPSPDAKTDQVSAVSSDAPDQVGAEGIETSQADTPEADRSPATEGKPPELPELDDKPEVQ